MEEVRCTARALELALSSFSAPCCRCFETTSLARRWVTAKLLRRFRRRPVIVRLWSPRGSEGLPERIAEIGSILAPASCVSGRRKSSGFSPETGESSLHFSPAESGHEPDALGPEAGS